MVVERLSKKEFRRRVVAGSFSQYGSLAAALEGLQFVQADPIRAPARAQDLILRHRLADYCVGDLEKSFPTLAAEEGYLFAYGFMRSALWQHLRRRPGEPLSRFEREVLKQVKAQGEMHPRRLAQHMGRQSVASAWGGKSLLTKRVLEKLHHQGDLRVCRRDKGVRVYALAQESQRIKLSRQQRYQSLALATAQVFGPTRKSFLMSELASIKDILPKRGDRENAIEMLLSSGQLAVVEIEGVEYIWEPDAWQRREINKTLRILAPFDPLVRDRERFEQLWGWRYRFEAYVPAARRALGYYAMPLLWRDDVIGWANARVQEGALLMDIGYVREPSNAQAFRVALEHEVEALSKFLGLGSGRWACNMTQ